MHVRLPQGGTSMTRWRQALRALTGIALVLSLVLSHQEVHAAKMYWTSTGPAGNIQRANLNGTGEETLVTGQGSGLRGIALDLTANKMYWASASTIKRANLDGSGVETLVTGLANATGLALDVAGGKMYRTDDIVGEKIRRANLNGSGVETLVTLSSANSPRGIALDLTASKMYWADAQTKKIQRANLDGTGVEEVIGLAGGPEGVALDVVNGKMYWSQGGSLIRRASLNGAGAENLVTSPIVSAPKGIALDVAGGKMYWVDSNSHVINRANLDGTGPETLVNQGDDFVPRDIALDLRTTCTATFAVDFSGDEYETCFRDVLRDGDINAKKDVSWEEHDSLAFTGGAGSGGGTWLTVYDATPDTVT